MKVNQLPRYMHLTGSRRSGKTTLLVSALNRYQNKNVIIAVPNLSMLFIIQEMVDVYEVEKATKFEWRMKKGGVWKFVSDFSHNLCGINLKNFEAAFADELLYLDEELQDWLLAQVNHWELDLFWTESIGDGPQRVLSEVGCDYLRLIIDKTNVDRLYHKV